MSSTKLTALTTQSPGRLLWQYSLPAIVGMLVVSLYNIVDRMFIGHAVGPDAIAGLTITFPVMNISTAVGVLVGVGASARTSILLGNKNQRGAEIILGNTLVLTIVNASIYLTVFTIFMDDILRAFGASEATMPYAREFLTYFLPGLMMMNVMYSLNNVMRSSGYPRLAMITMLIGAGCNVVLDPIFIFVLKMGIKGAAIASDIGLFIGMWFVLIHFMKKSSTLHFTSGTFRLRWNEVFSMVSLGAAPSIVNIAGCFINIVINNTLLREGGDNAVAAAGIFSTITGMLVSVVVGICQGMQPIAGYNFGAGQPQRAKKVFWLAVGAGTAVCTLGCIAGLTIPQWIAWLFTKDETLINVSRNALTLSMICFWMVGFQVVSTTLFQSLGKAALSIFLGLTRQVLFLIPLLLILPSIYGLDGVWVSFPISDFLATIVTTILVVMVLRRL
ncbi:MAG: MATE family efflux transporter [Muribaculaceae bacterium]|nr:MATE family efflux transporter [Muribaculaceae bacterium]